MPLTLAQIKTMVRTTTGNDVNSLPDADGTDINGNPISGINTFLNMTWWEFLNVLDIQEKQTTTTVVVTGGQVSFNAPAGVEAVRAVSYNDPNTGFQVALEQKDIKWYRRNLDNNTFDQNQPLYYIQENGVVYLLPIPDQSYTLNVDYWNIMTDLDIAGSIGSPRETGEILLNGTIWRVFSHVNGNVSKAAFYKGLEKALLDSYVPVKEKQEDDQPFAGLDYKGREYE